MPRTICVVHSEDALSWATFIKNLFLKQRSSRYDVRSVPVKDLAQSSPSSARTDVENAEVLVIVLTPEHIRYLEKEKDFTYHGLARGGQKGVLFFCGSSASELEGTESGGEDLRTKFPSYDDWAAIPHTDANNLTRVLDRIQPLTSLVYRLVPDQVRCENCSTVTVSFSEIIASKPSDLQVALYISNDDGTSEENVDVTWMNDKTVFFKAPERREGPAKVRLVVKGNQIPGTSNLCYESSCELMSEMMQLYIHALNHVVSLALSKSLLSNSELDAFLFKIFSEDEPNGIQPKAFEELFGIYRYNPEIKSHVELPTLLHFAKKFGFEKFHSWLENLPDATLASKVQNCEGLQAEKINKFKTMASASPTLPHPPPPFKLPDEDYLSEDLDEEYLDMETTTRILIEKKKAEYDNNVQREEGSILRSDKTDRDSDEDNPRYTGGFQICQESYESFEDTYSTVDLSLFCDLRPKSITEEEEFQIPDDKPVAQCGVTTDPGQQKLIQIMTQVKCGELTMEEANILFEEWKIQHTQKPLQKPSNFLPNKNKQSAYEMNVPLKLPSAFSKDAKGVFETLPSRLGRKRGSDASDKTSSTASIGSFDGSQSSAHSSVFSHSSGIDIDLIDEDIRSQRSSSGSIDGNTIPPPLPARDTRTTPSKSTTLPRPMPAISKSEGQHGRNDKR